MLALFYFPSQEMRLGYIDENLFISTNRDSVFLSPERFQNVSHNFKLFLYFQQYATCKMSRAYNKGFSYMLFLFVLSFHADKKNFPRDSSV